jgi:formate hydrogenlyase subunit 3/multisubunit Na+/H+ antiporter MnhD subunit
MTAAVLAGIALLAVGIPLSMLRGSAPALSAQIVGTSLVAVAAAGVLATGDSLGASFSSEVSPRFGIDGLSAFFVVILAVGAVSSLLFARDSLADSPVPRLLTALTAAFLLSLLGVLMARDVTTFLGFWELMTLIPATARGSGSRCSSWLTTTHSA